MMATSRHRSTRPPPQPEPPLPEDLATCQLHLKLARTQNAHLHRQLALALTQAPLAPADATPAEEVALALQALREEYAILKLHYTDQANRALALQHSLAFYQRVFAGVDMTDEQRVIRDTRDLDGFLKQLILLTHPDKWSQGQSAADLAHVITEALNAARERPEVFTFRPVPRKEAP
jgi:hypothetical protein